MELFWFVICLMIIIALLFVGLPLLLKPRQTILSSAQSNQLIYRDRLDELRDQKMQGLLTEKQYHLEKTELAQNALHDLPEKTQITKSKPSNTATVYTVIIVCTLLPILSVLLYLKWGASDKLNLWLAEQTKQKLIIKELAKYHNPQQLIVRMEQILQQHPDSARGWYLLGRLYMSQNEFSKAAIAFDKASRLEPEQPTIKLQYLESQFLINGKLSVAANRTLHQIQQQMPNSPDVINLLALDAYNKHAYAKAIQYWEQLLNQFSPTSNERKTLMTAITQAKKAE
jgi:cytochrome c-type biogenesis protein CcmH